jgi:hypothetical protein
MAGVADLDALKRMARGLKDLPPRVSVAGVDPLSWTLNQLRTTARS